MRHTRVHGLVLVNIRDLKAVPTLQVSQKQRWQHGHALNALTPRQPVAHGGRNHARNFGERVHRHALVGVFQRRVAEALQHHVTVAFQVNRAGPQHRYGVVGHVVKGDLANLRVQCAFVDVAVASQRTGPGDAAVGCVEQADLGFFMRSDRRHHFNPDRLPGRAAIGEVVFNHPLDEALAHDCRRVVTAGRGLDPQRHIRCGPGRDAVHHAVGAGGVGFHPGQQRRVGQLFDKLQQATARALAVMAQVVAAKQRDRRAALQHAMPQNGGERAVNCAAGLV